MTVTREVELRFRRERITHEIEIGAMANDDVTVEAARAEVAEQRSNLGRFDGGRVIA